MLGLDIQWGEGRLEWHDPATGRHIVTFDDQRARIRDLEDEVKRLRAE